MRFPHIRWALSLVPPLGLTSALFASLILAGYIADVEALYRPLSGGPATHPLTAVSLASLGIGLTFWRLRQPSVAALALAHGALAIAVLRLAELALDVDLLGVVTPFQTTLAAGKPIRMGVNTALMTATLAAALIADIRHRLLAAQALAFVALGFPLVSITGYAYGVDKFHGQMALTTVVAALPVGFGVLFASSNRGILRSILSPWVGGRIARVQIVLGYLVPFVIGYLLILVATNNPRELFGLFVVMVSAFISGLVAFSAVMQERIDQIRRGAERRLRFAANRDPLTQLPNRRMLLDHAERELERAQRNGTPLSILMLDIDHFKQINDRFGHTVGDQVLQRIAELMRSVLRKQDLPARFGGEEFVVLLPDTDPDGAARLAEKLRQRIAVESFPLLEGNPASLSISVSIGCADHAQGAKFHQALDRADAALYRAKAAGRNRVEMAWA
ncbi:MAG: GGDEF domain-containing protein [Rhodocyclaceae bacterium]|nr:GGDEF domain-containing protein [Rhodocyclaceae bacterium]